MKYEKIVVEKKEYETLKDLIASSHNMKDLTYKASVEKLLSELKNAKIVNSSSMPDDVVRFNSVVTIKDPYDKIRCFEIVKPEKSDLKTNKISVLAPMGLALYGYAKDDEVMWQFPVGILGLKIIDVQQTHDIKKELA